MWNGTIFATASTHLFLHLIQIDVFVSLFRRMDGELNFRLYPRWFILFFFFPPPTLTATADENPARGAARRAEFRQS